MSSIPPPPPPPPPSQPEYRPSPPHLEEPLLAPRPHKLIPDLPAEARLISSPLSSFDFAYLFLILPSLDGSHPRQSSRSSPPNSSTSPRCQSPRCISFSPIWITERGSRFHCPYSVHYSCTNASIRLLDSLADSPVQFATFRSQPSTTPIICQFSPTVSNASS